MATALPMQANAPAATKAIAAALLALLLSVGTLASLGSGLTWDEETEQSTFDVNARAVAGLLHGDAAPMRTLQAYSDRFYGIGFHALAYPFQVVIAPYLEQSSKIDGRTALLLAKHPVVFVVFALSVAVFYRLLRFCIADRAVASLFTAAYALYPYLFGHATMNVKDVPFLAMYLLCTYLSLNMARHRMRGNATSFKVDFVALLLATAALCAVRIPGIAIVVQYLVTLGLADRGARRSNIDSPALLRPMTVATFALLLFALIVATYPMLWRDTLDGLVGSLTFMSRHPWPGCTLTWGECVWAQRISLTYVPEWLAAKLPLFALFGLLLIASAWKKIAADAFQRLIFVTLIFGALYPIFFAIVLRSPLYDETRQLLFVYPLLLLLAMVSLYRWSAKASIGLIAASLGLFIWDDMALRPYQYVYVNEAARFATIDSTFVTDYWGASSRELGPVLTSAARRTSAGCIYAHPEHLYRPFVDPAVCVTNFWLLREAVPDRDYIVSTYTRLTHKASRDCTRIAEVARTFPLSNSKATMAVAYSCRAHPR